MKICYLDINVPDCIEDYSSLPTRYGGGRIIAASLLERLHDFHIYANAACFDNVKPGKLSQCFTLTNDDRESIKNGAPVKNYIVNADQYDLFFHHFSHVHLNLTGCRSQKQVVWPVGWREPVHPLNKNVMLFDRQNQEPQFMGQPTIYDIIIGPKFELFKAYPKEDIIFQCSRHFSHYQSIIVAQLALKYDIKTYFAGPIENGYPLIDYIDNKTTFYLGVIDSETKRDFYKRAKLNTQFQNYPISATLAGKEASSYGCGILASPIGGWKHFIKDSINGFFIKTEADFIKAWEKRDQLSQKNCYDMGLPHSEENMVNSILHALNNI